MKKSAQLEQKMRATAAGVIIVSVALAFGIFALQSPQYFGSQAKKDDFVSQTTWVEGTPVWPMHVINQSSKGADGVKFGDVNKDGLLDIVSGWENGGQTIVNLNPGKNKVKELWPSFSVGQTSKVEDAVFVDVDNDGALDVVSSSEGNTKKIFVNWAPKNVNTITQPYAWQTKAFPTTMGQTKWMYAMPLQIDGKNGIDLIAGSKNENAMLGWYESPANARDLASWKWHTLDSAKWIMSIELADMDRDGDQDIVVSDRVNSTPSEDDDDSQAIGNSRWYENPGPAIALTTTSWEKHSITKLPQKVRFLTVGDLNKDGLEDVVTAAFNYKVVYSQKLDNTGDNWQETVIGLPEDTGKAKGVAVGDINLDGINDIVVTTVKAAGLETVVWMTPMAGHNNPQWKAYRVSGIKGTKTDVAKLIDLDQDGDLDVVTTEEKENLGVIWFENPTR